MHTEVAIHSMNAYVWCWRKACGSLDEIPPVTMGTCKRKSLMNSNMTLTVLNLHQQTDPKVQQDFIYLFGVLRHFQHCTGHITTGSWKSRGNQYIQLVKVLYCKLPTNSKQLPAFPLEAMPGIRGGRRVLPLCHRSPNKILKVNTASSKVNQCYTMTWHT